MLPIYRWIGYIASISGDWPASDLRDDIFIAFIVFTMLDIVRNI